MMQRCMSTVNVLYVLILICESTFVLSKFTGNVAKQANQILSSDKLARTAEQTTKVKETNQTLKASASTVSTTLSSSKQPTSIGPLPELSSEPVTFSENIAYTQVLTRNGINLKDRTDTPIKAAKIRNLAYGDSFYDFIRDNQIWVDKSLLIKKIWQDARKNIIIITAPAGFGKTTNLRMIKFYCNVPTDGRGNEQKLSESANSRYFLEGKIKLKSDEEVMVNAIPLISTDNEFNKLHLGNHPVIHLEGGSLDMSSGYFGFWMMIRYEYERHSYLLAKFDDERNRTIFKSQEIDDDERDFMNYYLMDSIAEGNKTELECSIKILSRLLWKYYNKRKVIIIYDQHDYYIHRAFFHGKKYSKIGDTWAFRDSLREFMRQTFESNQYLEKGIITSVLKVVEATHLSHLNNALSVSTLDDVDFYPFYGIYNFEFDKMAEQCGITDDSKNEARLWYDGYRSLGHLKSHMYRTYMLADYINHLRIKNHREAFSTPAFLKVLLYQAPFLNDFMPLVSSINKNETFVKIKYSKLNGLTLADCETIQSLELKSINYKSTDHKDIVFSLMLLCGYATIHEDNEQLNSSSPQCFNDSYIKITLPNEEILHDVNFVLKKQTVDLIKELFPAFQAVKSKAEKVIRNFMEASDMNTVNETLNQVAEVLSQYLLYETATRDFKQTETPKRRRTTATIKWSVGDIASPSIQVEKFRQRINRNQTMKQLFKLIHVGELDSNEAVVQAVTKVLFWNALCARTFRDLVLEDDYEIPQFDYAGRQIDVYSYSEHALVLELKYAHNRTSNNITSAFQQCLGYAAIYRRYYHKKRINFVNFVAIRITREAKIEILAAALTIPQIEEMVKQMHEKLLQDMRVAKKIVDGSVNRVMLNQQEQNAESLKSENEDENRSSMNKKEEKNVIYVKDGEGESKKLAAKDDRILYNKYLTHLVNRLSKEKRLINLTCTPNNFPAY